MRLEPLADLATPPEIVALPKVDLHCHAEAFGRTSQVLAGRRGEPRHDQRPAIERAMSEIAPGMPRLTALDEALVGDSRARPGDHIALDDQPDYTEARFAALMEEAASEGALYVEVRCGGETPSIPHFMSSFRAAESRARRLWPAFHAQAITTWAPGRTESGRMQMRVRWALEAAKEGLAGVDFQPFPYESAADFRDIYRLAERAAEAGLGITCHAGEFSSANIEAALEIPGLTRLGHAVHAVQLPGVLEELARRRITVEVCLSSNVILGAVPSYEEHPIRRFVEAGVLVTIATDDPLRVCTTIGREYAIAAALGFSQEQLAGFTRDGINAAFVSAERKARLLEVVESADVS
jgi:adenosine deaminase